jgi:hypothetical protein
VVEKLGEFTVQCTIVLKRMHGLNINIYVSCTAVNSPSLQSVEQYPRNRLTHITVVKTCPLLTISIKTCTAGTCAEGWYK